MDKKTFSEMWYDDRFEEVYEELDDGWRHGNNHYTVFKDEETGKFWAAQYRVSGDGEYHGLRPDEMDFEFWEVTPVEKVITTIDYVPVKV